MLVNDLHLKVPDWFIPDPFVCCPLDAFFHWTRAVQGVLIQPSFGSHAVEDNDLLVGTENNRNEYLCHTLSIVRNDQLHSYLATFWFDFETH